MDLVNINGLVDLLAKMGTVVGELSGPRQECIIKAMTNVAAAVFAESEKLIKESK